MKHTPDSADTAAELKILLTAFIAEVMRYDSDDTLLLLKQFDLTLPLLTALHIVDRHSSATISEISTGLECSLANTSVLVDKLVCSGFVTRAEDAHDRRHKQVRLTEKGQGLIESLRAARVERVMRALEMLPPDRIVRAVDVLRDVLAGMEPAIETKR